MVACNVTVACFTVHFSGSVPVDYTMVVIQPKLPDKNMQVTVDGEDSSKALLLNVGDTVVAIKVSSADGTNSQVGHYFSLFLIHSSFKLCT